MKINGIILNGEYREFYFPKEFISDMSIDLVHESIVMNSKSKGKKKKEDSAFINLRIDKKGDSFDRYTYYDESIDKYTPFEYLQKCPDIHTIHILHGKGKEKIIKPCYSPDPNGNNKYQKAIIADNGDIIIKIEKGGLND